MARSQETPVREDPDPARSERLTFRWLLILLVLVLLSEETAYAYNLVTPALPRMAAALRTSQIAWAVTVYPLSGAVAAPLLGKLADMHGKKRILLGTVGVMVCGSLVAAVAPSLPILLVGRVLEGSALAILPLSYSLMRDVFPKRLQPLAVSIATSGIGLTGVLAPYISGYLVDHFGYRAVFCFLAGFPLVLGLLVLWIVPESPVRVAARLDVPGALLLALAIVPLLLAVSEGSSWGWGSGTTLGCLLGGAALLLLWFGYERLPSSPLIELRLLTGRALSTTMLANFLAQGVIAVHFAVLAFLLQTPRSLGRSYGFGYSVSAMAWVTSPAGLLSVLTGFGVGYLVSRRGARLPLTAGFALMTVGSVLLALLHDQPWQVYLGFVIYSLGGGMAAAAIPNLVIAAVPSEQQAVGAGMVNLVGGLGSAVCVQLAFAVLLRHVVTVVNGQPIYAGSGFTLVYLLAAAASAIALLAALVMRHGRRPALATAGSD